MGGYLDLRGSTTKNTTFFFVCLPQGTHQLKKKYPPLLRFPYLSTLSFSIDVIPKPSLPPQEPVH